LTQTCGFGSNFGHNSGEDRGRSLHIGRLPYNWFALGCPQAATQAAKTRLRPILMTSFAFILGVAPLVVATGAGSEMRQSLGTAVSFGMLGVTGFGLVFTPAFYTLIRKLGTRRGA